MRIRIKPKKNDRFKKPQYWVAMGALAACSVSGSGAAKAQTASAPQPPSSGHALAALRFAIEAGTLEDALKDFERVSGWKVAIPAAGMRTLASKGAAGLMSASQALRRILTGTGLAFDMTGESAAMLRIDEVRSSIDVTERAPVASPRYTEPCATFRRPSR